MAVKISTLCENTAGIGDFLGEWGLSILVETPEATVLLDTGKAQKTLGFRPRSHVYFERGVA